jgi:hypothetical protein
MTLEKLGETTRFTRRPEQTSRRALTAQGDLEGMEHAKQANGSGHELSIGHSPSSARKKAVQKKAESPGRSGRRRAASRNQRNWVAAIAGAMTWLRVSSSGGIGDAASVSVNAMGRRPGRGRRRSRNSSNTTSDEWPGSKGLGPFRIRLRLAERGSTKLVTLHPSSCPNRLRPLGVGCTLFDSAAESHALREVASVCIATWCNGRRSDIEFW